MGLGLLTSATRQEVALSPWQLVSSLLLLPRPDSLVLVVSWTLQYEVFFYALVGLAIVRVALFKIACAILLVLMATDLAGITYSFPMSFFSNHLILLFGIGMLVSVAAERGPAVRRPVMLGVAGLLIFFGTGALYATNTSDFSTAADLMFGASSGLVIFALVQLERSSPQDFASSPISVAGDASYALYLIHFPIVAVLCKIATRFQLEGLAQLAAFFCMALALCLLLAIVFHVTVERPVLKQIRGRRLIAW